MAQFVVQDKHYKKLSGAGKCAMKYIVLLSKLDNVTLVVTEPSHAKSSPFQNSQNF